MFQRFNLRPCLVLLPLLVVLLAAGCGGKGDKAPVILAEVGDRQITADYFQDRLARLKEENLPRDADGQLVDMASLEGKRRFLEVIIDKEVMVAKALQLGYLEDPTIAGARHNLTEYYGMIIFWQDRVGDPSRFVADADLDYYYSRLGENRRCEYLITDTRHEAVTARNALLEGMSWSEAVARYHRMAAPEDRTLQVTIPWGHYRENFQRPIFAVEKGELTEPIESEYGWWIMRIIDVTMEAKPDLESIKGSVLVSIAKRKEQQLRDTLISETLQKRGFELDEEVLRIVYAGLPEGEGIVDPETKQPLPTDQLKPLVVPTAEYDRELMSYQMSTGRFVLTLADYKAFYDRQNVFERPRKSAGLGSLRAKLKQSAERAVTTDEAVQLGYMDDPRVEKETFGKLEEMLVDRVNKDLVSYDEYVPLEEIEAFFAEHRESFNRPELRSGTWIRCASEEDARAAAAGWRDGSLTWRQLMTRYAVDKAPSPEQAQVGPIAEDPNRPLSVALFALSIGEIGEPFATNDGWAVVRLDHVHAPERPELKDVTEAIGHQIKAQREDGALRALLDRWREEFGVEVDEKRLAEMPSWQEAVQAAAEAALRMPEA